MSNAASEQILDLSTGPVRVRIWDGTAGDVLLVHGALVDGRLWDAVVPLLAGRGLRVVVPDLPLGGHRLAQRPGADLSPPAIAGLLGEIAERLGLRDVVLAGNDSGGAIAQIAAARGPDWLRALVLTPADILENFPPSFFKALPVLARRAPWALTLALQPMRSAALRRSPLLLGWLSKRGVPDDLSASWLHGFFHDPAIRRDTCAFAGGADPRHTIAAAHALAALDLPVVVSYGTEDRFFPRGPAERLAAMIPGARLEAIEDSFCFSPIDQPARTADLIASVLPGAAAPPSGPDASVAFGPQ